ncbi:hypothetical protein LW893_06785 [Parvimonas micra]|jgi:hypothetical protein|uniref:hypothetical protein n=1 Tax=Parvimonas micra TaxID=33033 RepID=UPI001E5DA183|nr:hypothetical protein [Parvimonas micra]MCE3020628.1 hypothetical protein [Parvimonas micra]
MSAFLAPIHFWMYDKILIAQELTFKLEEKFLNKEEREEVEGLFPGLYSKDLEEVIDQSNIHGWLHTAVSNVEIRFAYIVKTLLDRGISLEEIKKVAFEYGKSFPEQEVSSLKDAYELLMDILLDGLPCDVSISVSREEENELEFILYNDIHKQYFNEFNLEVSLYHEIREAFVNGIFERYSLKYKNISDSNKLITR